MWVIGLQTLLASAAATWLVTPWVVRLASGIGALDAPGPRKVHQSPTPRIGGLAIFVGLVAGTAVAAVTSGYVRNDSWSRAGYWSVMGVCATAMLLLGLVDDIKRLSFRTKFTVQILAACAVWSAGFRIDVVGVLGPHFPVGLGSWSFPVTVLWVVGVTNAFNLIDGLDGLAAGTALISTLTIAIAALQVGRVAVAALSVALAGSLIGFLRYNFNPARIFLGDSGSMFLGFSLAVISIHGSQKNVAIVAVLTPLLLLGYPILDTAIAIARRIGYIRSDGAVAGDGSARFVLSNIGRVFLPDRGHLHHKLLEIGMSHRAAVLSLYACAAAFAAAALALVMLNSLSVALAVAGTVTVLTVGFVASIIVRARYARRRRSETQPDPPLAAGVVASGEALERSR